MRNTGKVFGLYDFLLVSAGSVVFALSFVLFLEPCHIAPGGISGIGMVISHFFGFSLGSVILVLNIPLILLAYLKFGARFIASTLYATAFSAVLINLGPAFLPPFTDDLLLAALYGGLLLGIGMGLVFAGNATTGGSDIISRLVRLRYPHIKLGRIVLVVDVCIILLCAAVFQDINLALYAAISLYVSTIVIDAILYGSEHAVLTYIISDRAGEIGDAIQIRLERGITYLTGSGGHTGQPKQVILCVVRRNESAALGELVEKIDPEAFFIISEARQVFGFGFLPHHQE